MSVYVCVYLTVCVRECVCDCECVCVQVCYWDQIKFESGNTQQSILHNQSLTCITHTLLTHSALMHMITPPQGHLPASSDEYPVQRKADPVCVRSIVSVSTTIYLNSWPVDSVCVMYVMATSP